MLALPCCPPAVDHAGHAAVYPLQLQSNARAVPPRHVHGVRGGGGAACRGSTAAEAGAALIPHPHLHFNARVACMHSLLARSTTRSAASCRLRVKMVARVTMEELVAYLQNRVPEWPARQLQALEIILNSPFINDPRLLYQSRTLFELAQVPPLCDSALWVRPARAACWRRWR